jgi:transcription elongation factor GreA
MTLSRKQMDELRDKEYEPFHVTEEGLNHLKEKLVHLKHVLPERAEEARRTAAYGDRSENDEYKTAKAALRRTNFQILKIENQINRAEIIKSGPSASGAVQIGSTVKLEVNGATKIFQILGPHETNPANGRISYESPLGKALMNRKKGDAVVVGIGNSSKTYKIIEIK